MRRLIFILFLILMCGCGTRKTVTNQSESMLKSESSSLMSVKADTNDKQMETIEHKTDSIVERFRTLIVTDSIGNIIYKEEEHSGEKFKGFGYAKAERNLEQHYDSTMICNEDSTSSTEQMSRNKEVNSSTKPPWGAIFCVMLLVFVVSFYWIVKKNESDS